MGEPASEVLLPRVLMITALDVLSERDLFARLEAKASLPREARARMGVQLRDPQLCARDFFVFGERLRRLTLELGISFWVNDRVDAALLLEADGLHLGRRSISVEDARSLLAGRRRMKISVSSHSPEEVIRAAELGADMVLLSPIFRSPGKGEPLGVQALIEARKKLEERGLFVFMSALGGVDALNAKACFEAGADGVAAIRADLCEYAG